MNSNEAAALIAKAKYRDWSIRAIPEKGSLKIEVAYRAENSDEAFAGSRQPSVAAVSASFHIAHMQLASLDARLLGEYVYSQLKQMVLHETGEWFIWQGERPFYPHKRSIGGAVTFP